jgi:hypothetical protein
VLAIYFKVMVTYAGFSLTLILLMWRIWWANNTSKWQMGFNSAFKGLKSCASKHFNNEFSSKSAWLVSHVCGQTVHYKWPLHALVEWLNCPVQIEVVLRLKCVLQWMLNTACLASDARYSIGTVCFEVSVDIPKWPCWYLNFCAWFMKNVLFERKLTK